MSQVHESKKFLSMKSNLIANGDVKNKIVLENHWVIECVGEDQQVKWVEEFDNLVVTAGLNHSLQQHLKGSAYTAAWYISLTHSGSNFQAADVMSSHAGWTENLNYSQASRPALVFGAVSAGSVDNSASPAVFSITGTTQIHGAFMVDHNLKNGNTGTLYGGANFNEGIRSVVPGDTLNVSVYCTATSP